MAARVEVLGADEQPKEIVDRVVDVLVGRYGKHLHQIEFGKDDVTVVLLDPPDVVFMSYSALEELVKKR